MVKIGTKIVYRNQVCTVADIALKYRNNEDFYVLTPFRDETLLIRVPISIADTVIRPLITQLELDELIKKIPDIETVPINNWNRGTEYKELLSDGTHESVIRIIKTSFQRQKEKAERKQKANENDKIYFRQAERLFYDEIAASLNIEYEAAKDYIIKEVAAITTD